MYISKKKRKGTYRYLKEKKNIPKGFSRYPPLLLSAVRFFYHGYASAAYGAMMMGTMVQTLIQGRMSFVRKKRYPKVPKKKPPKGLHVRMVHLAYAVCPHLLLPEQGE